MGVLIGILKSKAFWPIAFFTLVGTAISAINFRSFWQLADANNSLVLGIPEGQLYRLAVWLICPVLLLIGLLKMHRLRIAESVAKLLNDEEPEG